MKIKVLAGETVHATTTQFRWLAARAPEGWTFDLEEGPRALRSLADADLFIAAGLYWTGSSTAGYAGHVPYPGITEEEKHALRDYVASGRPVLAFHGGIASFDDWPEYGRLLGFAWHWDITAHGPVKEYRVFPVDAGSPLTEGVQDFIITDESYFNVQLVPGVHYETHLKMQCGDLKLPMLLTTEGGRVAGAGRAAYLALGHDMRSVEHPAFSQLLWNTIRWLRQKP